MDKYTVTVAYPHWMQEGDHLETYTESVLAITPDEACEKVQSMASEANRVGGDGPGPDDFEVLSVVRDETYESVFIKGITNEDTGGGCRVDFIELQDGSLLTLNDEAVCWHQNRESFNEGEDVPTIYFGGVDANPIIGTKILSSSGFESELQFPPFENAQAFKDIVNTDYESIEQRFWAAHGPTADAIKKLSEVSKALEELLNVMNQDTDGDYFICAEASDVVDAARKLLVDYKGDTNEPY